MVAKEPSTDSFAAARSELEVARDVFSSSEQVTVEATEVIFVVRVVTVEFSGFAATMVLISVTMVMISAQLAAALFLPVELELLQQVQAAVPFVISIWQVSTIPLNVVIALRQADTSVMLGRGMLSVEHAALTLTSHPLRRVARSVKFFAPLLLVEPWQLRAAELPPPDLMIRWAVEAKMPFFPFFFSPVLLAATTLPCCFW